MDLLSARHHTLDGLLGGMLKAWTGQEGGLLGFSATDKLSAFETAVRKLRTQGMLPIAFLDEFESLALHKDEFGDHLLESWRSLGNDGQVAFVTSSAQPLDRVTHESGLTSSFYNIFAQVKVGEFSDRDMRAFLSHALFTGRLEQTDEVFLQRVGGNHPLRLQVTAWQLWEARRSGLVDYGVVEEAVKQDVSAMMKG